LFEITTITIAMALFDEDPCQHAIGEVVLSLIEKEEAAQEIVFRSNSGTERNHDLAEGQFSP
jgi:hypothetical protein